MRVCNLHSYTDGQCCPYIVILISTLNNYYTKYVKRCNRFLFVYNRFRFFKEL